MQRSRSVSGSGAARGREVRLYNTAARSVEAAPLDREREVRIYTCGPTVYRSVHLGNLRSYFLADWLKRLLVCNGFQVRHVKNITDVGHMRQELLDRGEDKLIAEALRAGLTPGDIARRYTEEFFADEARVNILPADVFPRATDHVGRMISIVAALASAGHAYERNGNVYFRVNSFSGYGELGGSVSREGLRQGVRAEADPLKEDPRDFALWKAAEPGRTELVWSSPWGRGFPGWHIECTAMSTEHLGPQIDIHTGGVDNIFPHHEDERAQSEAFTGQRPFARVWLHGQHLLADGLKMAKSTGNAYTLGDLLRLEFEPLAFRYLCMTAHYRARLNFTFTSLRAAQTGLRRLRQHVAKWGPPGSTLSPPAEACRDQFWSLAAADLALPRCLALVWSLARGSLANLPDPDKAALARDFDRLLGVDLGQPPRRRPADPFRGAVSSLSGLPDGLSEPDRCLLSVDVVVQPEEDLEAVRRCVTSVVQNRSGMDLEVVLVDATGSPDSHVRLASIAAQDDRIRLVWIDHDPGAGAARNLGLRASHGRVVALLDPSVELTASPWPRLLAVLEDALIGAAGPFGLVTADLRHFHDAEPPPAGEAVEVDALQNYLMVFRRSDLRRIGPLDEHYRFYRILDLDLSYAIRARVGRIVAFGNLPLIRHRHALWEALSEGDREERSRKNFGRFLKRWDHRHDLPRHGTPAQLVGEAALHG
ncbi:MAG: cysteine--tRNA ligase [Chloroflexi bacterium]|nr:MAG: cysteine--tRNA ligase [Chloroflexota bacterium]